MKKKSMWTKLTISVAVNRGIDGVGLVEAVRKFIASGKKFGGTFIPLGSAVGELTPEELMQVVMSDFPVCGLNGRKGKRG